MKQLFLALLSALLLPSVAWSFQAGEPQHVSYASGADRVPAEMFLPSGSGRHPAVLVIHEWWGLNDWVRQQAKHLAEEGYIALAVDLYRGKVAADPDTAHQLMRGLPQDRGIRDLEAAFHYLASRPDVLPERIGAVGWCMGGGFALHLAIAEPRLRSAVINYGPLVTDREALAHIHASILGNFGGQDKGITPEDVEAFRQTMQSLHKSVDTRVYPLAGHAFQNPANASGYRPEDTADAQSRIDNFFTLTLKKQAAGPR